MEQLDDRAFRRGYRHGYNQAHDDITRFKFKNSKILKMINHYLLERISIISYIIIKWI